MKDPKKTIHIIISIVVVFYFAGLVTGMIIQHRTINILKSSLANQDEIRIQIDEITGDKERLVQMLDKVKIMIESTERQVELIRIFKGGDYASVKYKSNPGETGKER